MFFGPDTYRFASFLADELRGAPRPDLLIEVGAGSGAGADVTAKAVAFARINLRAAGLYALSYRELDPDIFADTLTQDAYRDVERIAAVGAVITRR